MRVGFFSSSINSRTFFVALSVNIRGEGISGMAADISYLQESETLNNIANIPFPDHGSRITIPSGTNISI